jgi:putative membrane protein
MNGLISDFPAFLKRVATGVVAAIPTFLKGAAMGAANVIPGVSGGTIAFITGIYERLVNSLKSFDVTAIGYLRKFEFRKFVAHVDFWFLASLLLGALVSIVSLSKGLKTAFENYPTLVWAFFFGLILASIFFVGKMVTKWSAGAVVIFVLGGGIASAFAFLTPAAENPSTGFLVLCGVVAICSMIIPGLSGSFVLLIMGNYMLVLGSLSELPSGDALRVLIPFGIGCAVGLLAFAHLLSWVFKNYHDLAVALLTGFVVGSLAIIWPWKTAKLMRDDAGELMLRKGKEITAGYEYFMPDFSNSTTHIAIGLIVLGAVAVWVIEKSGQKKPAKG